MNVIFIIVFIAFCIIVYILSTDNAEPDAKNQNSFTCPICGHSLVNNNIGNIKFENQHLCKHCSKIIDNNVEVGSKLKFDLDYLKSIVEEENLNEQYIQKCKKEFLENQVNSVKNKKKNTEHLKNVSLANNCLANNNRYAAIQFYIEALKVEFKAETQKMLNKQLELLNKENGKNIKYNADNKVLYDGDTGEIL